MMSKTMKSLGHAKKSIIELLCPAATFNLAGYFFVFMLAVLVAGCGGSGGGVLTAWIVGHTDRFTAAVSMRPVINWHSFVGNTDGASWYRQFEKFPWEDPMEYALRSPLHYVANVTTPTMVMTGESDLRTPMTQSEEYYRALKMLKKDTLLVRMPNEFHGWRRPSHRMLQQLYLMAWFEKYMKTDK